MKGRRALQMLLGTLLCFTLACSGGTCKKWTAWIVGETVERGKNTAKGVKKGIAQGRKEGESLDEAKIVTAWKTLQKVGSAEIHRIDGRTVELAVSNDEDVPLRVTNLEILVLNREGFAREAAGAPPETTVPADAKRRVTFRSPVPADRIAKVRIWEHELDAPAPSTDSDAGPGGESARR